MKSIIKAIAAAALCAVMLTGCALVRVNPNRVTVAKVGDTVITLNDVLKIALPILNAYDMNPKTLDKADILDATQVFVDSAVNEEVQRQKMAQSGIVATDEDRAAAEAQIDSMLEYYTNQYFNMYLQEGMDVNEAAETAYNAAVSLYFTAEYPRERLVEEQLFQVLSNRLRDMEVTDVVVDDSEIRAVYDEAVAGDKAAYEEAPMTFDQDWANDDYYYVPDGTIFVRHILIGISDEDAEAINALSEAGDYDGAAARVEEATAAVLPLAEEVLAKVQAGEDFEALIAEYGTDPSMEAEEYQDGYIIFPGFTGFVESFYEASMTLAADGDMTGLVKSDYGYHIIKRVGHLEAGPVPFEQRADVIHDTLMEEKGEEAYNAVLQKWREELNVVIDLNKVDYKVDIMYE